MVCLPQISYSDTWAVSSLWTAALIRKYKPGSCWLQLPLGNLWHKIFQIKMAHLHTEHTNYQPACMHTHSSAVLTDATSGPSTDPAPAAHLCLHLVYVLSEIVPKSSCRGVLAPPSASSSCAVSAMPSSHGSLYGQLHRSGRSSGGQHRKLKN